ncbi:hypothetical protein IKQ19_03560 [Candidatus Saccharibacteria bacterium]|nr:hypothetical protein [Candidatus Saccharibacteria bacterium]
MNNLYKISLPKIILKYEFIDNLDARFDPLEVYGNSEETRNVVKKVAELFKRHGWEGDGEIKLIWLPPFLDEAHDPNFGEYIWHVKQKNNGTSFLGFQDEKQSTRLLDQNEIIKDGTKTIYPQSIVKAEYNTFLSMMRNKEAVFHQIINLSKDVKCDENMRLMLLSYFQNDIIALFIDFLEECCLQLLIYVLSEGNASHLKLKFKGKINVELANLSDCSNEGGDWLTLRTLISQIWHSQKNSSFENKLDFIIDSTNYQFNKSDKQRILMHVEIRNCIQHHMGQLHPKSLKLLKRDRIDILQDDGTIREQKEWEKIKLTISEISRLKEILIKFATAYELHIKKTISDRVMLHVPNNFSQSDDGELLED